MPPFRCDPAEVQAVKDALARNANDVGVGILHEPTDTIHLVPIDTLPFRGGHAELAAVRGLNQAECKGFAVLRDPNGPVVPVNLSHLNGSQGTPGSLQMPQPTFDDIVRALRAAGL